MLLKNSPMRSALHFIEHGWCDEVTHIARSVSFDYYSKSAQRDSIEGKHSFRTFKPLLNRIASGPALLSPRNTSSERNSHAIAIDPSGGFSHPSPAGCRRRCRRHPGHRLQLGAKEMTQKSVTSALVSALSPICVDRFRHNADAAANLTEFKKVNSWQQGSFIEKGGWATMPGSEAPNSAVAESCASALGSLEK